MASNDNEITIIGSGGHALSVLGCLTEQQSSRLKNVVSQNLTSSDAFHHLNAFNHDDVFLAEVKPHRFINGIGAHPHTAIRRKIFDTYRAKGFKCETVISPLSMVHDNVTIGEGAQIFAGAKINIGAVIGDNTIINTGAIIEHGAVIESHCHIAPGAIILGDAVVRSGVFIGAGAVIFPAVEIGSESIVGSMVRMSANAPDESFVKG